MIPNIVNVVSVCDLKTKLNLYSITNNCCNVIYNPSKFIGIVKKLRNPKSTVLIFPNGKLVITGTKTESDSKLAARKIARLLNKLEYTCCVNDFKIANIVATV